MFKYLRRDYHRSAIFDIEESCFGVGNWVLMRGVGSIFIRSRDEAWRSGLLRFGPFSLACKSVSLLCLRKTAPLAF